MLRVGNESDTVEEVAGQLSPDVFRGLLPLTDVHERLADRSEGPCQPKTLERRLAGGAMMRLRNSSGLVAAQRTAKSRSGNLSAGRGKVTVLFPRNASELVSTTADSTCMIATVKVFSVLRYKRDRQRVPLFVPHHGYWARASESAAHADGLPAQCGPTSRRLIVSQTHRLTKRQTAGVVAPTAAVVP